MLYNIKCSSFHIFAAKVQQKNHIRKFFGKKKYYLQFTCIFRKKVVILWPNLDLYG